MVVVIILVVIIFLKIVNMTFPSMAVISNITITCLYRRAESNMFVQFSEEGLKHSGHAHTVRINDESYVYLWLDHTPPPYTF